MRADRPLRIAATAETHDFLRVGLEETAVAEYEHVIARSARALVNAARRCDADAAVVTASEPGAALAAVALRASGVAVWWIGPETALSRAAIGATQVVTGWPSAVGFDRLARSAGRPGSARRDAGPSMSIVITTLDEGDALDEIVQRLAPQLATGDELVVIDGGSSDGSVERVSAIWADDARISLSVHRGAGISAGRNAGVRASTNEIVICTDAGCDPADGWVDGMRRAFADGLPGLVSGTYAVASRSALEQAQAVSCYADAGQARRTDLLTKLYTSVFGLRFDPRFTVGRSMGFTKAAWASVGGFPESLPTGEDVSFGLAVAEHHRVLASVDANVTWHQRDGIRATWRMYRNYGIASSNGGDRRLLVRDAARGLAYVAAVPMMISRSGRRAVALGSVAYLSLPVQRAKQTGSSPAVYLLLPIAMIVKDLGKLWGAAVGATRRVRS